MALIATELGTLGTIHKLSWRNGEIKNPKAFYYSLQTFASNFQNYTFRLVKSRLVFTKCAEKGGRFSICQKI